MNCSKLELVGAYGMVLEHGLVTAEVLNSIQAFVRSSYDETADVVQTLSACSTRQMMAEMVATVDCSSHMVAGSALCAD